MSSKPTYEELEQRLRALKETVVESKQAETERMRAEDALKKSEEKYRNLFETAMVGLYRTRIEDGQVLAANQAFADIFGYDSPDQLIAGFKTSEHYVDPALRQKLLDLLKSIGKVDQFEILTTRRDGSTVPISVSAILYPEHGVIEGVIIDMTERKAAEKEKAKLRSQLQQAHKMQSIGTLAGGVAHDFNNLLMGIQGRTSLMLADIDTGHPFFENLSEIEKYVASASELTNQLLGFARGGKYQVLHTDLNDLIEKSAYMFGRTKKELTIHQKCADNLWKVEVDRSQINQVLLNIYVNAWQAMPIGGELSILTGNVILDKDFVRAYRAKPGKYVKILINDSGIGMNEDTLKRVFDPFFTTKEKERGTGLGLASAYGIIKNHDGFITAESQFGTGSTFNLFLPVFSREIAE
jgi:two-component system cell cycle sensor histidine kinase/response regulator CckA